VADEQPDSSRERDVPEDSRERLDREPMAATDELPAAVDPEGVAGDPGDAQGIAGTPADPLVEARAIVQGAADAGVGVKLLGGLAVRVLCPDFPPRVRRDQDMDLACLSGTRTKVAEYLEAAGCTPDRRFNSLNGHQQMYFNAPSGRPIDVMVDQLSMCHTLDFRKSFDRRPLTLDVVDILLTKLQIVEMNEKDARDILQLLGAFAAGPDGIDETRFAKVLGSDWGWWRTVTKNLAKLPDLAAEHPGLLPPDPPHDPLGVAAALGELAEQAPKSLQWKVRARVGERVRWYELPEEVAH
jgi:hypothetical protein